MPTPSEILEGLSALANGWLPVAVAWHVVLGIALVVLAGGWAPSPRLAAIASAVPLASVSAFAWLAGNPFNGVVMAGTTVALVLAGSRVTAPLQVAPAWARGLGAAMIGFGWIYPHFLERHPAWMYLVAAPLGLVPCPSLAVVLGLGLCAGAFGSRAWAITAGIVGLFYGVFGVLRLGVMIDAALVVGALGMLALAATSIRREPAQG